jgi:ribonuclease HII
VKEKNANTKQINSNLYEFESMFWEKNQQICGIDEVGRGCLAGPVVAAAVMLNPFAFHPDIKDSKLLNKKQLETAYAWIIANSSYAIGISNHRIIDKENIYQATKITMKKALFHLFSYTIKLPNCIVIDAMPLSLTNTAYHNIAIHSWIQGERKSASIAAASIVAKVTRDKIMANIHQQFPAYGLDKHKGYGTAQHTIALKCYKETIIHRQTFIKNLKENSHEQKQQSLFC